VSRERVLLQKLHTLDTLEDAVGALRALSAQHFRAVRALLPAAQAYRDEIMTTLGALWPAGAMDSIEDDAPCGVVLIAADLGLVGDYTASLVREALALRAERGSGPLFCLGHRAAPVLERAGVQPDRVDSAPTSIGRLPTLLLPLVDEILARRREGRLGALWLVAARFEGAGRFRAARVPVLPITAPPADDRASASPYSAPEHLRAVVVREYLYAVLHETLLESLASEHGTRLVTTESARSWLLDRIAATRRRAASIRREASTQEVLEVVTASRAARRDRSPGT
jgi:F-type H+-transporting ATPase subunit gamma